ncbi:MAG: bile acid:sodium symporter [Opitutaceae bacterium]|nr:bile acid:sodium symporter [Opitutaceae bacterium]
MAAPVKKSLRPDWFLSAMFAAVALAALAPGIGATGGPLRAEVVTKFGVMAAFYVYGLTLSFAALKGGALQWRLHLAVQVATFLFFPLLAAATLRLAGPRLPADLALGLVYLCAMPSTISSAVALTAVARGNVPGAVFNATLSSLLGVVLTPVWLHALGGVAGTSGGLERAILDIARLLVLPMIVGQLCRPFLAEWAARHRPKLQLTDRLLILFLIYATFCDSFEHGVWRGQGWELLIGVTLGAAVLFAVASLLIAWVGRILGFSRADRTALLFCGTQKSLAQGATMSRVLLAGHPAAGLVLLPLMIYHALQLVVGGLLAPRWAKSAEQDSS